MVIRSADLGEIKSVVENCVISLYDISKTLLAGKPLSNSAMHNLMGLPSIQTRSHYVLWSPLRRSHDAYSILEPQLASLGKRNIRLTDDCLDQVKSEAGLEKKCQTVMSNYIEALRQFIKHNPGLCQAEIGRKLNLTLPDLHGGNKDFHLRNIINYAIDQNILVKNPGRRAIFSLGTNSIYKPYSPIHKSSRASLNEALVCDYLDFNYPHIPYVAHQKFPWCKYKNPMHIDIYFPQHQLSIEIQGAQHYNYIPYFHQSEEVFIDQIRRDMIKKQQCEEQEMELKYIDCRKGRKSIIDQLETIVASFSYK